MTNLGKTSSTSHNIKQDTGNIKIINKINSVTLLANFTSIEVRNLQLYTSEIFSPTPDSLCGVVVRMPGYRPRGPGWIPGTTRFSACLSALNAQEYEQHCFARTNSLADLTNTTELRPS
jgi:hypothetical protein